MEIYGEYAPSIKTCETCFRQFKSGAFNLKDSEHSGRPQSCQNEHLQELLDDNPTQIQQQLAKALNESQETISWRLRAMEKSINRVNWSHTI
ncbi:histone-lysine N-methyltransferase SETMAR [Trichonephila clavata]|uniref:Histone-lysine N-methyltransferase SETMAR n=1 Tax=Trichonephila clavata TaxID=2740835 RepID=A0A8X6J5I0_TRICU|nr:histone-lysine N-methyltransferase SETMAR [Trichonephila clavata]